MDLDYVKIVVTVVLAVIGWLVGHFFTTKRDVLNKRRELTVKHLINTYRILANEVSHRDPGPDRDRKLENLLTDIQLFGSHEQIELAKQLANTVAAGGNFELSPIISSLRNDLRIQLNLGAVEGDIKWLRFDGPKT